MTYAAEEMCYVLIFECTILSTKITLFRGVSVQHSVSNVHAQNRGAPVFDPIAGSEDDQNQTAGWLSVGVDALTFVPPPMMLHDGDCQRPHDDWNKNLPHILNRIRAKFQFLSKLREDEWAISVHGTVASKTDPGKFGEILSGIPPQPTIDVMRAPVRCLHSRPGRSPK